MNKKILFCDAESSSLRGQIFAVAIVGSNGEVIFNGFYKHEVLADSTSWVAQNVKLSGEEFVSREDFLKAVLCAYEGCREEYGFGDYKSLAVCGHMPVPVEANLFDQLHKEVGMGEFSGPYHMLSTDTLMWVKGEQADSESGYAEKYGLTLPEDYQVHTALSDAQLTRIVWDHLTK